MLMTSSTITRPKLGLLLLVGILAVDQTPPANERQQHNWNFRHTPRDLPSLDWAATPPAPEKRLQKRPLDMAYPEVASLLEKRMAGRERSEKIRATAAQIIRLCHLLDFQPSFILAVIDHESSFKPQVVSSAGAVGLMQLMPATGRVVARDLGIPNAAIETLLRDPVANVTLGMHYLAQLQDDFRTLASTLAAYNLGPQRWLHYLAKPGSRRPQAVARYVAKIEATTRQIREAGAQAWTPRLAAGTPRTSSSRSVTLQ